MLKAFALAAAAVLLTGAAVAAQDWVARAPAGKRVLVDNAHFRVVDVVVRPGAVEPAHTHPEYVELVLEPARMMVTYQGKAPEPWVPEKGKAYYGEPDPPHSLTNIDSKPLHLLLIELKDKPFVAAAPATASH